MALVHVIKKGPMIDAKHVGSDSSHRDESDTLWLDGAATKPSGYASRRWPVGRRLIGPVAVNANRDRARRI